MSHDPSFRLSGGSEYPPSRLGMTVRVRADPSIELPPTFRIDASGAREDVGYIGTGDAAMFRSTHLPSTRVLGGVVICSPLFEDFRRNYRSEVILFDRWPRAASPSSGTSTEGGGTARAIRNG